MSSLRTQARMQAGRQGGSSWRQLAERRQRQQTASMAKPHITPLPCSYFHTSGHNG